MWGGHCWRKPSPHIGFLKRRGGVQLRLCCHHQRVLTEVQSYRGPLWTYTSSLWNAYNTNTCWIQGTSSRDFGTTQTQLLASSSELHISWLTWSRRWTSPVAYGWQGGDLRMALATVPLGARGWIPVWRLSGLRPNKTPCSGFPRKTDVHLKAAIPGLCSYTSFVFSADVLLIG